jgi:hypothetical protein
LHSASRTVALAGVQAARQRQRIEHLAEGRDATRVRQARELRIQEADVEWRVVNDELRAVDEGDQLRGDLGKLRRLQQLREFDTVHGERAGVDLPFRIQVTMEFLAGRPPVGELDATDFDDAMASARFEAGGFDVQDDLPHGARV